MPVLEVNDFSGGMTDKHIDAAPNKFELADNFVITINNKLNTRPGTDFFTTLPNNTRIPIVASNERIGMAFVLEANAFFQSANNLFYGSGGAFSTLLGPTGNSAFHGPSVGPSDITTTTLFSQTFWNKHWIIVNDAFTPPRKVYNNESAVPQIRTAGLRKFNDSATAVIVRSGVLNSTITVTGLSQTKDLDVGDYVTGTGIVAGTRIVDVPSSTSITLSVAATLTQTSSLTFSSLEVTRAATSITKNVTAPFAAGTFLITVASTAELSIGDTVSGPGIAAGTIISSIITSTTFNVSTATTAASVGVNTLTFGSAQVYTYAYYYYYRYFIATEEFEDFGPTTIVQVEEAFSPNVVATRHARIPVLGNGRKGWPAPYAQTHENYDVSNIKIKIHRSLASQSTLFFLREIANGLSYQTGDTDGTINLINLQTTEGLQVGDRVSGTNIPANTTVATIVSSTAITMNNSATGTTVGGTVEFTIVDSASDESIENNIILYTDGGVYDNDPPPQAKYVNVVNDIAWYGHVKEDDEIFTSRVRQSIKFDFDSCPEGFAIDLEDEVTGIGSVQIYPIVGCKNHIFRLEGVHDELGRGFIDKREISRATGLISNSSIVNTIEGMFFAGTDGFYYCDAYRVIKVSDEINDTYRECIATAGQKTKIVGTYYEKEQQVWWAVQRDQGSPDADAIFVLHLRYGIKRDAVFTTLSGGTSFSPTHLVVYNGSILRTDRRGYVFKFDDTKLDDPKVDTTASPADWQRQAIVYDYRGPSFDFDSSAIRKWVSSIIVNAQNVTNISIGVFSNNDESGQFQELKEIRIDDNITWGAPGIIWSDPEKVYRWNNTRLIDQQRRFPARSLRCNYKQIQFTNAFTNIINSDALGQATVDNGANTATIIGSEAWPTDAVDYFIAFENDGYVREYQILVRTATVLTLSDTAGALPTGASKWIIRGIRKGEVFNLVSYAMHYNHMTASQTQFKGDIGENA